MKTIDFSDEWHFTEAQLISVVNNWLSAQYECEHPVATKQAQFVAQQLIKILKDAHTLKVGRTIDPSELDINNLDHFKLLLGMDWKDIK